MAGREGRSGAGRHGCQSAPRRRADSSRSCLQSGYRSGQCFIEFTSGCRSRSRSRDQSQVPPHTGAAGSAHGLTHDPLGPIAPHGTPQALARDEHDPPGCVGALRGSGAQYKKRRVRYPAPTGEQPVDVCVCGDCPHRRPCRPLRALSYAALGHRTLRPLRRRAARTARPALVDMRFRNPCVFARFRLFGWYVRFT
jgi:hypothetical protein